jgi:hypothetical protein
VTAPVPIASGDPLFPPRLNPPPWTFYLPSWTGSTTNPNINNGLLEGWYRYLDTRTVAVRIRLQPGSTTSFGSGQYRLGLPVTIPAGGPDPLLQGTLLAGVLHHIVGWANAATGAVVDVAGFRANTVNGTSENMGAWTNAAPLTFASGHNLNLSGIYYLA